MEYVIYARNAGGSSWDVQKFGLSEHEIMCALQTRNRCDADDHVQC